MSIQTGSPFIHPATYISVLLMKLVTGVFRFPLKWPYVHTCHQTMAIFCQKQFYLISVLPWISVNVIRVSFENRSFGSVWNYSCKPLPFVLFFLFQTSTVFLYQEQERERKGDRCGQRESVRWNKSKHRFPRTQYFLVLCNRPVMDDAAMLLPQTEGHIGIVETHSPPTFEIRVWIPAHPQLRKLVVACRWLAFYSTGHRPTVCTGFLCPCNYLSQL